MNAHRLSSKVLLSSALLVVGCVGDADRTHVDAGDNNPGIATAITGPAPDLVETAVGDPPASVVLGETFSATDTVSNTGSADAAATFTKYYLSSSGTSPQYFLGNRTVGAIAVGGTDSGNAAVKVPGGVPQGSYRIIACADSGPGNAGRSSQVTESNENNNCSASAGSVVVTGPDLIESNVSASPTTVTTSGRLTISDTVTNIGPQDAGASVTRWFLSTDNVRDSGDAFIRNCDNGGPVPGRNVGTISAGGSSAGQASTIPLCVRDSIGLHPPATGAYYVLACADSTNAIGELNESNNCAASAATIQVNGGADLIETSVSDPPATGTVGTSFSITDTAQNIGGDPAPSTFTKFYLSNNGTFLNTYVSTRSVGALATNGTDTATTTMSILAGTPPGTYRLVACADSGPGTGGRTSQVAEINENNNCVASAGSITIAAPDLVVTALSDPPATGVRGSTFTVTDTTLNQGTGDAGAFFNKYYLSSNGTTPLYLLAPGAAAGALTSGASETVTATAKIPAGAALGMYWVLDCADSGPGTGGRTSQVVETNENNNCFRSATQIVVQ
jgi:subtilase family serine protease